MVDSSHTIAELKFPTVFIVRLIEKKKSVDIVLDLIP